MNPALPERPAGGPGDPGGAGGPGSPGAPDGPWLSADDVGTFDQGNEFSRWALARYIVGRVILERVSWSLLVVAAVFLVIGALFQWLLHSTFLAVLAVLVALFVLLLRAVLRAVLRRLMAAAAYGPLEDRVRAITNGASAGVLAELRRVGLPGRLITLPLLVLRLIGKRRKETMARIREFDVERAVPKAKRDELHMVLRQSLGRQSPPQR